MYNGITNAITQSAAKDLRVARDRVVKARGREKQARALVVSSVALWLMSIPVALVTGNLIFLVVSVLMIILGVVNGAVSSHKINVALAQLPEIWDDYKISVMEKLVMGPMAEVVKDAENAAKWSYREPVFVPVYEPPATSPKDAYDERSELLDLMIKNNIHLRRQSKLELSADLMIRNSDLGRQSKLGLSAR